MKKHYRHLTLEMRSIISYLTKKGYSLRYIGKELGVHHSTIDRELKRNCSQRGYYNVQFAQEFCKDRKQMKKCYRKFTEEMKDFIDEKIKLQWSPEQIVGYCRKEGIAMVSHESIYQYVYSDKINGGKLWENLRTQIKHRKVRTGERSRRAIEKKRLISERPAVVDGRGRVGDWEIDLIVGENHQSYAVTAVERKTGYMLVSKILSKRAEVVRRAVINMLAPFKERLHTITSDNGLEFAQHETISKKLGCTYYFCDPYASWQRGLNEYTNKLIRQYIPKKADINLIDTRDIIRYQNLLNSRPRKKLGYKTPSEVFFSTFVKPSVAL